MGCVLTVVLAVAGSANVHAGNTPVTYTAGKGLRIATPSGAFSLRAKGLATFDVGAFDGGTPRIADETMVRDAIANVSGRVARDVRYEFVFDFSDADQLPFRPYKNVVATYDGADSVSVTLGNQKVPFSHQHLASPPLFALIERSLAFALAPRRRLGASVGVKGTAWQVHGGVFTGNINDDIRLDERVYALRGTYAPRLSAQRRLHLGAAVNVLEPNPDVAAFGAPPETLLPRRPLIASGRLAGADTVVRGNLEAGVIAGPLSVQGEYHRVRVDRARGPDPAFQGGHVQLAYVLTGETRPYLMDKTHMLRGVIGPAKPADPLRVGRNGPRGIGAWELAARASALDLRDAGVGQGRQWSVGLGVSWYANAVLRLSASYLHTETAEPGRPNETVDAGLVRVQVRL